MGEIEIIDVREKSPYLDKVEDLLRRLYDDMSGNGLATPLVLNGEKVWRSSLEKTLGRFSALIVAVNDQRVVGFASGILRHDAPFIGGKLVGYITYVFVEPDFRRAGVGEKLLARLDEWFRLQNIEAAELQVLCDNENALLFWERQGYKKYLVVMRKEKEKSKVR